MKTNRRYSQELKKSLVKKMMAPGGPSASALSRSVGISQPVLSKWVREYGHTVPLEKEERSPDKWTNEEKVQAVLETARLSDEELGLYLRRTGIHSTHLERWKVEIVEGMKSLENPGAERREQNLKIRELERELKRKEKALAEAAILLILKKKAETIWGVKEDDELK